MGNYVSVPVWKKMQWVPPMRSLYLSHGLKCFDAQGDLSLSDSFSIGNYRSLNLKKIASVSPYGT